MRQRRVREGNETEVRERVRRGGWGETGECEDECVCVR